MKTGDRHRAHLLLGLIGSGGTVWTGKSEQRARLDRSQGVCAPAWDAGLLVHSRFNCSGGLAA